MSGTEQPYERILAYLKGLLSNRQRHDLERDMMRDMFDEDAFEGLSQLSAGELEADMKVITSRLDSRIQPARKHNLRIYYSLAAGIFLMAGIGSILYLVLRKPATELITQEMDLQRSGIDTVSEAPATMRGAIVADTAGPAQAPSVELSTAEEKVADEVVVMSYGMPEEQDAATTAPEKKSDYINDTAPKTEQVMQDREAISKERQKAARETEEMIQGKDEASYSFVKPVPPGGSLKNFSKWVYENLDFEALKDFPGKHAVRVYFSVQTDGHISNVQIRDSLPDILVSELKSIILQSPSWKPALRDNTPVDSQVEVSLIISVK